MCPYKQMFAFRLCFSYSVNHSYSFTDHSSASKRKFLFLLLSDCMLPALLTSCFVRHQISTSPFLFATSSASCRIWKLFSPAAIPFARKEFSPLLKAFLLQDVFFLNKFQQQTKKKENRCCPSQDYLCCPVQFLLCNGEESSFRNLIKNFRINTVVSQSWRKLLSKYECCRLWKGSFLEEALV